MKLRELPTKEISNLPGFPTVSRTGENSVIISWNVQEHHYEIELTSMDKFEWFYRNRFNDYCEGGDWEF